MRRVHLQRLYVTLYGISLNNAREHAGVARGAPRLSPVPSPRVPLPLRGGCYLLTYLLSPQDADRPRRDRSLEKRAGVKSAVSRIVNNGILIYSCVQHMLDGSGIWIVARRLLFDSA